MKRIYVSCASAQIERAERCIAYARELGLEVIHDWPAEMRRHGSDAQLDASTLRSAFRLDMLRAHQADALVLLYPDPGVSSMGVWWECGAFFAMGERPEPMVVSHLPEQTLDLWTATLAKGFVSSDRAAIDWLFVWRSRMGK